MAEKRQITLKDVAERFTSGMANPNVKDKTQIINAYVNGVRAFGGKDAVGKELEGKQVFYDGEPWSGDVGPVAELTADGTESTHPNIITLAGGGEYLDSNGKFNKTLASEKLKAAGKKRIKQIVDYVTSTDKLNSNQSASLAYQLESGYIMMVDRFEKDEPGSAIAAYGNAINFSVGADEALVKYTANWKKTYEVDEGNYKEVLSEAPAAEA